MGRSDYLSAGAAMEEKLNLLYPGHAFRQKVLYTGPDGMRDYIASVETEHRKIGIGPLPQLESSEVDYIPRPAPPREGTPYESYMTLRRKTHIIGEIGWRVQDGKRINPTVTQTAQIPGFCFDLSMRERVDKR